MGESTTHDCLCQLSQGMVECAKIFDNYLRSPTKNYAHRIVGLHGSLNSTNNYWVACPARWKGQFQGKEGYPATGLETVADDNLWIWHSAVGFA